MKSKQAVSNSSRIVALLDHRPVASSFVRRRLNVYNNRYRQESISLYLDMKFVFVDTLPTRSGFRFGKRSPRRGLPQHVHLSLVAPYAAVHTYDDMNGAYYNFDGNEKFEEILLLAKGIG
eukprot:GHVU01199121.1.p2 GENE.GHVU01199121.1~~GHVU01199121.1.p2  ORF type:complete len:120 (-),score=3.17 GHVU01199121.1:612-971(-)